jgi:hypothetical protein
VGGPISQKYDPSSVSTGQEVTHDLPTGMAPSDQPDPQQRPASEPPQAEHLSIEGILKNHGVDGTALSASQLQLFKTAEEAQQQRLIELWRICPPSRSTDNPALTWENTSIEQEEMLARVRLERLQIESQNGHAQTAHAAAATAAAIMSLDGTLIAPVQAGDGRWLPQVQMAHYMEPYMSNGYEAMARREYEESAKQLQMEAGINRIGYSPATDPAYRGNLGGGVDWAAQQRQQAMENQYGAFQQHIRSDDMEML